LFTQGESVPILARKWKFPLGKGKEKKVTSPFQGKGETEKRVDRPINKPPSITVGGEEKGTKWGGGRRDQARRLPSWKRNHKEEGFLEGKNGRQMGHAS